MIQQMADWLTYGLLGLDATSGLGSALNFFIYDSVKILLLLFVISALMGVVNAYFPIERLRNYLMTHRLYGLQYLLASVFGAITPFCSCSSIPLFIGFVKGGIPLSRLSHHFAVGQRGSRSNVSWFVWREGHSHLCR